MRGIVVSKDSTLVYEFSSDWNVLKDLREKLLARLQGHLEQVAEPIVMTSSELVENAIKYGESALNFHLSVDSALIEIRVSNIIGKNGDYNAVEETIKRIQESDDPFELYTERLMELMNNPQNGPTRIGLIRIAYEGKFELNCEKKDDQITIHARRKI
jgi:hypothetical protein